jgi:hypothetical protein
MTEKYVMKEHLQNTYETLTKHLCTYILDLTSIILFILRQYLCFFHVSFTSWIFFIKIYSTKYLNFPCAPVFSMATIVTFM